MTLFCRSGCALLILLLLGCAGGGDDPVMPSGSGELDQASSGGNYTGGTNRYLWGYWEVDVDQFNQTVTASPSRAASMHLNMVKLLEDGPCTDCLTFDNIDFSTPGILSVDLTLRHPYPGNLNLTGFDVRGILVTDRCDDYLFAWGEDLPWLLNADGHTKNFRAAFYPSDPPKPPLLDYYPGEHSNSIDLRAFYNPFLAYNKEAPRRMFSPGTEETRTAVIVLPNEPFLFGYAVDACWAQPDGVVTDPVTDFPPDANCVEPYMISVHLGEGLTTDPYSMAEIEMEVFDHQGLDTIWFNRVYIIGAAYPLTTPYELEYCETTSAGGFLYKGLLLTHLSVEEGYYPLYVLVGSWEEDPNIEDVALWYYSKVFFEDVENSLPVAQASAWPQPQIVGKPVDFYDDGSYDPDGGTIVKWEWDWENDGIFDVEGNPATHTFDVADVYHVNLRVTDDEGSTRTLFEPLEIVVKSGLGWARHWGTIENDVGFGIAADDTGDVYVVGAYRGTADFDPGPEEEIRYCWPYSQWWDAFLTKFDKDGNFQWVRTMGGSSDSVGRDVSLDGTGNVYIGGCFSVKMGFEGDPAEQEFIAEGYDDCYLAKYDTEGTFQWAVTWGGEQRDLILDICIDGDGNIYSTGFFEGTCDFDPGPGEDLHYPAGEHDAFISKISPSGELIWVRTWGKTDSSVADDMLGSDVATDPNDDVYVTGCYDCTADFDPGPGEDIRECAGWDDAYLCKFTGDGEYQWVRAWGAEREDYGYSVDIDQFANIYVTGGFRSTVDFDPGSGVVEYSTQHSAISWPYLCKYDREGNFIWALAWGTESYGGDDAGRAVATDIDGNVVVAGNFNWAIDFDPGPGIDEWSSGGASDDIFVSKFNTDGEHLWARTWGSSYEDLGADSDDSCYCIDIDQSGFIYLSGDFLNIADFDPGPGYDWHIATAYYGHSMEHDEDIYLSCFPPDGNW